ncbi:hypothetical protein CAOG_06174 [Capsaspora owczarzaki ATCC 30864]|uniref:hypothetical protein n=1 Tax=Capsaspora owczarzaki (strain ATCC 30864) TaxID=595528 RepID=UPI0003523BDA|nr:hypothetical protein CAOG_06174 [Capsaspora owczarzaki ATCC 30864]|eukprot:XP_004345764.2 hypothetical protein CAOG_06174 [Capsaspora owczarzaki ATCC 30864]
MVELDDLPDEVLELIFERLDLPSLLIADAVSRRWRFLTKRLALWKRHYQDNPVVGFEALLFGARTGRSIAGLDDAEASSDNADDADNASNKSETILQTSFLYWKRLVARRERIRASRKDALLVNLILPNGDTRCATRCITAAVPMAVWPTGALANDRNTAFMMFRHFGDDELRILPGPWTTIGREICPSPDGMSFAAAGSWFNYPCIVVSLLDGSGSIVILTPGPCFYFFWSPDSTKLTYLHAGANSLFCKVVDLTTVTGELISARTAEMQQLATLEQDAQRDEEAGTDHSDNADADEFDEFGESDQDDEAEPSEPSSAADPSAVLDETTADPNLAPPDPVGPVESTDEEQVEQQSSLVVDDDGNDEEPSTEEATPDSEDDSEPESLFRSSPATGSRKLPADTPYDSQHLLFQGASMLLATGRPLFHVWAPDSKRLLVHTDERYFVARIGQSNEPEISELGTFRPASAHSCPQWLTRRQCIGLFSLQHLQSHAHRWLITMEESEQIASRMKTAPLDELNYVMLTQLNETEASVVLVDVTTQQVLAHLVRVTDAHLFAMNFFQFTLSPCGEWMSSSHLSHLVALVNFRTMRTVHIEGDAVFWSPDSQKLAVIKVNQAVGSYELKVDIRHRSANVFAKRGGSFSAHATRSAAQIISFWDHTPAVELGQLKVRADSVANRRERREAGRRDRRRERAKFYARV